jgi:hypothetical protein
MLSRHADERFRTLKRPVRALIGGQSGVFAAKNAASDCRTALAPL